MYELVLNRENYNRLVEIQKSAQREVPEGESYLRNREYWEKIRPVLDSIAGFGSTMLLSVLERQNETVRCVIGDVQGAYWFSDVTFCYVANCVDYGPFKDCWRCKGTMRALDRALDVLNEHWQLTNMKNWDSKTPNSLGFEWMYLYEAPALGSIESGKLIKTFRYKFYKMKLATSKKVKNFLGNFL